MTDVENIRYELGKEARAKGEPLHENASEEFQRGYLRGGGSFGFASNVTPRRFGRGGTVRLEWTCVCGYENRPDRIVRKAGREACWECGTEREFGDIALLEEQNAKEARSRND